MDDIERIADADYVPTDCTVLIFFFLFEDLLIPRKQMTFSEHGYKRSEWKSANSRRKQVAICGIFTFFLLLTECLI
jgi:hypothetical protein